MTHPDDNTLAQLVDGALDDARRAQVEHHLDTCVACSDLVAELAFVVTPDAREAPPGYRLVRELDGRAWDAIAVGDDSPVMLGFGGPWSPALVQVRHPGLAAVHAVGRQGDAGYIVHERGTRTLRQWRAEVSPTPAEIARVGARALAAVAALHEAGLAHGRLSPEHIFIEPDGRVVVGALAREVSKVSGYVAPEVLDGAAASPASDQFATCAVIWEALANARPFSGATLGALAVAMAGAPALPVQGPRRVFVVLQRGLAADPAARWPSAIAASDALVRATTSSRSRTPIVVGLVALVIAALVFVLVR